MVLLAPAELDRGVGAKPLRVTLVVARTLIGLIFVMSGIGKLFRWTETVDHMVQNGFSGATGTLLGIAVLVEIVGGLSVITGTLARFGALALVVFLIPTTVAFHDFWAFEGAERQMQMANFLKNLSLMGGLLLLVLHGAGPLSVDRRFLKPRLSARG